MGDIYEISSLTNATFNKPFAIFNYHFWHYVFEMCQVESRRRPVSLAASCQEGYQSKNLCQIKHVDPSQCGLPLGVQEQPKMKKTIPLYSYRPSKHDLNSWPWSKLIAVWLQILNRTRAGDCVDFLRNIKLDYCIYWLICFYLYFLKWQLICSLHDCKQMVRHHFLPAHKLGLVSPVLFLWAFFLFFWYLFLKKWRQHFQISCIHVHLNSVWFVYNYHVFVPDVNVTKPCHSWNVKSVSSAGQEVGMET